MDLLLRVVPLLLAAAVSAQDHGPADPVRLEDLPRLPGLVSLQQSSSHNREGANGDARFCLYRDADGDAVVLDVHGPGCVRSIWATEIQPDATFLFWFDGEAEPRYRIPMTALFGGAHPHFPAPLCSLEPRGRWGDNPIAGNCFVPIPFAKGLRIAVAGDLRFYHVLYETYPFGTEVRTFDGTRPHGWLDEDRSDPDAQVRFAGERERVDVAADALAPGEALVLLDRAGHGTVRRLVVEADVTTALLTRGRIEMRWDGHPLTQIRAPLGYFFGLGMRAAELRSLALQSERLDDGRLRLTCRLPMPFWDSARIELVNGSDAAFGPLHARVEVDSAVLPRDGAAHLVTRYHAGTTTWGRDWTFLETPGTGRLVGVVQSMLGGHYCEGDEHFYVDGAVSPQIHGTGTEDYYLGCFWPSREYADPFAWCVGDVQMLGGGTFDDAYTVPAVYGRFHLEAPVPFLAHLAARIQAGGSDQLESHYESLAFAYVRARPALTLTDVVDVGNAGSEAMHGYQAEGSAVTPALLARPEGAHLHEPIRETGRTHEGGEIRFRVALDPENTGVRLRRRLDQASGRQAARVFVDGAFAGLWYHADHNPYLRWFDADLDVDPRLTRGKERIDLRLEVVRDGGYGAFNDFRYSVFCVVHGG